LAHHPRPERRFVVSLARSAAAQLERLQSEQLAGWEAEEAARRARFPDWQWHLALPMPRAGFDPSAEEQQQWADRYRSGRPDADSRDRHGNTPLAAALLEWRNAEASRRWEVEADRMLAEPACAVCGAACRRDPVPIGAQNRFVCPRCRASVTAAMAAFVAKERVGGGGRTRAQAAADLVAELLDTKAS
jgi:hypothetical protein